MVVRSASSSVWRAIALSGVGLAAIGIGAFYFDIGTDFKFALSLHYSVLFLAIAAGALLSFLGFIGWARQLGRRQRLLMAALIFLSPWAALLLGYPIAGTNAHGPAGLIALLIIPASILAVVLLVMAVVKSSA